MSESAQSALSDARRNARMLEESLADLAAKIEERGRTQKHLSDRLNLAARRLRAFPTPAEWCRALVEAARDFCDRAALFAVNGQHLHLEAVHGFEAAGSLPEIPLDSAPAFSSAVESKDAIVAMRIEGEISAPIAAFVGASPGGRCSLFPILALQRVPAILYADASEGQIDRGALELLAILAGLVLDSRAPVSTSQPADLFAIASASPPPSPAALPLHQQQLHLRAQRFARVRAARIRLHQPQTVKNAQSNHSLYTSLQQDIDSARETFRNDFLTASPKMVDYLHLEFLRTLANNDGELFGPEYPGPMA